MIRQSIPRLWLRLDRLVTAVFVAALIAGMLVPVYSDEVGWRLQERAAIDGVDKLYSDQCGANTLAPAPWFMMPARIWSAFFNTRFADPLWIRLSGVTYALFWCGLFLRLVRRLAPDEAARRDMTMTSLGLMGLGMMPLLLVWSRPEQPLLLAITGALLLWLGPRPPRPSASAVADWTRPFTVLALATIALSYHFKALLLMPAFLLCLGWPMAHRPRLIPRLLAGGLLLAMTAAGARYWFTRLNCPADPVIAAAHARESLGLGPLLQHAGLWQTAVRALGNYQPNLYFAMAAPMRWPMSRWLEPRQISWGAQHFWHWPVQLVWWLALAVAVLVALHSLRASHWRPNRVLVMAMALFGAASAWIASQLVRHVYEANFVLPLLTLAMILPLGGRLPAWLGHFRHRAASMIGLAMLASVVLVDSAYGPSLARATAGGGAYLPDQPWSMPVFGFATARPRILAAARICHIPTDGSAHKLMIDEATYLAFVTSPLPQHYLGLIPTRLRGQVQDPVGWLRAAGSSGAILGCHRLPPEMRARARQNGEFCCLAPPDWGGAVH